MKFNLKIKFYLINNFFFSVFRVRQRVQKRVWIGDASRQSGFGTGRREHSMDGTKLRFPHKMAQQCRQIKNKKKKKEANSTLNIYAFDWQIKIIKKKKP